MIKTKDLCERFGRDEMFNIFKQENSFKLFNPSDIKPLDYKDLDGKTLKMAVVDNDECLLVAGVDKEANTIYMLYSKVK